MTAALYLSRANFEPVLYEGLQPGGQLTITTEVDNFPGFPEGILGPDLMDNMRKQVQRFGAKFSWEEITQCDLSKRPFTLTTSNDETVTCDAVIISTGATARFLNLENETRLRGRGVSACATCDGFFFSGVPVAVVGGGDSALEEATFLTRFASKVYVIHRRDALRGSKIMQQRAFDNPKIELVWNSQCVDVLGEEKVTGIRLENKVTGELSDLEVGGLFLAIGHTPNTGLFKGQITLDEDGYIITKPGSSHTSVPGVFACGDVQDRIYRQAITAAGSGCWAALDCERWIEAGCPEEEVKV
jgi:thioredoxin reductase (NADPH)